MTLSYSAPAKIILSGEHAAVYGKPLIISALSSRLIFSIWKSKKQKHDKNVEYVAQVVRNYLTKRNIQFVPKPFDYEIKSDIPQGMNLGSSAAFSVAASAALLHFYSGKQWNKESINNIAYEVEKMFHGNPSGGDNSASCYGGLIFYRKEFEFLKTLSVLPMKIPQNISDHLFIIDSGKPVESTKEMVMNVVGSQYNSKPKIMSLIFNEIEKTTKQIILSISSENPRMFKDAIADNEKYLEKIGAVSMNTKKLLASLRLYGVGKVTGAGGKKEGSGNILFFAANPKKLINYLQINKIAFIPLRQDYEGVKYLN